VTSFLVFCERASTLTTSGGGAGELLTFQPVHGCFCVRKLVVHELEGDEISFAHRLLLPFR
jgi:hypothetical protein